MSNESNSPTNQNTTETTRLTSTERTPLNTRPSTIAMAISAAVLPAIGHAEWGTNVEVFTDISDDRTIGGVAGLVPVMQDDDSMTFVDGRAFIGNGGTNEFNIGVGHRMLNAQREWIYGAYGSFDTRETSTNHRFNQISLGAEMLGDTFDARVNGYISISDKKAVDYGKGGGEFEGNKLYANGVYEEALSGFDAEVGVRIPTGNWETRAYLGGYHFSGDVLRDDANGYRVRIETRPLQNIVVGLSHQDDDVFGNQTFLELRYSFGYEAKAGVRTVEERMIQMPVRDLDIVETSELGNDIRESTSGGDKVIVSNSVVHIDSAAYGGSANLGTFEDPYISVPDCTGGDCPDAEWIYVHEGAGTYNYSGSFGLNDGQHLIGSGVDLFEDIVATSHPTLTTTSLFTDNVTLADDNEVAGLHIDGAEGYGISGYNADNANIHDNIITDNDAGGIHLEFDVGNGDKEKYKASIVDNNISYNGSGYYYGSGDGINIESYASSGGSMSQVFTITDNRIYGNREDGIDIDSDASSGGRISQTVLIDGNYIGYNGDSGIEGDINIAGFYYSGGRYSQSSVNLKWTISDNEIYRNSGDGVDIETDISSGGKSNQTIRITENWIYNNYDDGIDIENDGGRSDSAYTSSSLTQKIIISDNVISENSYHGIYLENWLSSGVNINQTIEITGNYYYAYGNVYGINNNGGDGIRLVSELSSGGQLTQTISINGNAIVDNENDGIHIEANTYDYSSSFATEMTQKITISDNTIEGNWDHGIYVDAYADADSSYNSGNTVLNQSFTIKDNLIGDGGESNTDEGIFFDTSASSGGTVNQTVRISGNTIESFDDDGVRFDTFLSAEGIVNQDIEINDNDIAYNDYRGIYFDNGVYSNATLNQTVTIKDNWIYGNGDTGIAIYTEGSAAGRANQVIDITGNDVNGNGDDGIHIYNNPTSGFVQEQTLTISNNTVNYNSNYGIYVENYTSSGGTLNQTLTVKNNTVNGNGEDGIRLSNQTYYIGLIEQTADVSGNTVKYNSGDGLYVENYTSSGGSILQELKVSDNKFIGNGDDGINIVNNTYTGGFIDQSLTIKDNTVSYNYDNGMYITNDYASAYDTILQDAVIDDNKIIGNGGNGIYLQNYAYYATARQTVSLKGNTIRDNAENGIRIFNKEGSGTAIQTVDLSRGGNKINDNGSYAVIGYNDSSYTALQTVDLRGNNDFSGNGSGYYWFDGDGSQVVHLP